MIFYAQSWLRSNAHMNRCVYITWDEPRWLVRKYLQYTGLKIEESINNTYQWLRSNAPRTYGVGFH